MAKRLEAMLERPSAEAAVPRSTTVERAEPRAAPAAHASASGKTQYFTASSLDGFIADPDNSLDWLYQAHDDEHGEGRWEAFIADVGAMTMGATTYEWVLQHERLLEEPQKWHAFYDDIPCWVFSHRELPAIPGADLRFVEGDVGPVHEQMTTAAGGKKIWLVGGGDLVGQFADQGLLDEIQLHVAPVTLGVAPPSFHDGSPLPGSSSVMPRRRAGSRTSPTRSRRSGAPRATDRVDHRHARP
jgi:dihydrofolate reductase